MAYYPDLSPSECPSDASRARNVGWLDRDQPFPRGPVSCGFAFELRRLAENPVELTRGYEHCPFCQPPLDSIAIDPRCMEVWEMLRRGHGEIRVTGEYGDVYHAPELIFHYVAEHQYQPPAEFVAAVLYQCRLRSNQVAPIGQGCVPLITHLQEELPMSVADPKQRRKIIGRIGIDLLENKIYPTLDPADTGKFVVVDTISGAYEVDNSDLAAVDRLYQRYPDAEPMLGRFGYSSPYFLRSPL